MSIPGKILLGVCAGMLRLFCSNFLQSNEFLKIVESESLARAYVYVNKSVICINNGE